MTDQPSLYSYAYFTVVSPIPLPLPEAKPGNSPSITVTFARTDRVAPSNARRQGQYAWNEEDFWITTPQGCVCTTNGGSQILLPAIWSEHLDHLVSLLLAVLIPAAAIRQGCLILHAACVDWLGCTLCFLGGSGAGKSTLTAAAVAAGARFVADDLLLLGNPESERESLRTFSIETGAALCVDSPGLLHLSPTAGVTRHDGKVVFPMRETIASPERGPSVILSLETKCVTPRILTTGERIERLLTAITMRQYAEISQADRYVRKLKLLLAEPIWWQIPAWPDFGLIESLRDHSSHVPLSITHEGI